MNSPISLGHLLDADIDFLALLNAIIFFIGFGKAK
jgi:hypothetical protein